MATIEYSVAGQQIVVTKDEKLVENTIGVYTVGFTFDAASWGDFTQKTAVFVHEDFPDTLPYEVPIDDGEAPIPAAVLKYGNIMIGVYGSTQTQQYPTIWAPAKRVWPGAGPGVEPPEDPVFGMVVRTAPQELTEEQQEIARTNIGAAPEVIPDSTPGDIAIIGSNGNVVDGILPFKSIVDKIFDYYVPVGKVSATGWRIIPSSGLCVSNASYMLVKYPVSEGDILWVDSNDYCQFQNAVRTPSSGEATRVGKTYENYHGFLVAPSTATYIVFSTTTTDSVANAYKAITKNVALSTVKRQISRCDDLFKIGSLVALSHTIDTTAKSNVCYYGYIPVAVNDRLQVNVQAITGVTYKYRFAFYKSDKTYHSQSDQVTSNIAEITSEAIKYFAFTVYAFNSSTGQLMTDWTLYQHLTNDEPITIDHLSTQKTDYINADDVSNLLSKTDIITLNDGIINPLLQAQRPINQSGNAYLTADQPVVLLHFSDIHGDYVELQRIVNFAKQYAEHIDDVICTGDILELRWTSDFTWWDAVDGADKILIAIGNHDVLTDPSGWDWSQRASQADQYSRYFAPNIASWGVTYTNGKTYYYKDYATKKVRLIVLNCMLAGDDATAQLTWFASALSDAKTNGLSVVVANHYMIANATKINCNFTTIDKSVSTDVLPSDYMSAVNDFVSGGGKFVCYISGHTHSDFIVKSSIYTDQINVVVDALSREQGNQYSDTQRTDMTKSQDLANLIIFDTASKAIKIIRIGASMDHYVRAKNAITINYDTGDVIASW